MMTSISTLCRYLTVLCSILICHTVMAQSLPLVNIYATGGTIAGVGANKTNLIAYQSSTLSIKDILPENTDIDKIARINAFQFANVPSDNIDNTFLLKLANTVNHDINQPSTAGIVITHGTDTLEETAFFLSLTTQSPKPIVIVGAMRPASAVSTDGPLNLLQGISVAANPKSAQRGVLITMNARIYSAYYATKTNTLNVDSFKAPEQGALGAFLDLYPVYYYSPALPTGQVYFNIANRTSLPKVSIIYMHTGQDDSQIDDAITHGAKGIVIAGNGNGNVPDSLLPRIAELMHQGIPVVVTSRTGSGITTPRIGSISAGLLNAQKARMLLMLALAQGDDIDKINHYFQQYWH